MSDSGGNVRVLIGCSGSVATIKLGHIVSLFQAKLKQHVELKIILTENAKHFAPENEAWCVEVLSDADEWSQWQQERQVLHVHLAQHWADVFCVAPLDANTLAKLALGITDNLLTSVARAWDLKDARKRIVIAPAMNSVMWSHPVTQQHLDTLQSWGYHYIPPIEKMLACKTFGIGAMAEPEQIVDEVINVLTKASLLPTPGTA